MKKKYKNMFFVFGVVLLILMLTQLNYEDIINGLQRAGYWFPAVVALWGLLYIINTAAWYVIIRSGGKDKKEIGFWWLYKVTVSGFALNYATPCGLMGGEPYRIMELTPRIGVERATSSVLLYVMTHIFSHFWFWLIATILYVLTEPLNTFMSVLLAVIASVCIFAIWFFIKGYRKGIALSIMRIAGKMPVVGKHARRFTESRKTELDNIDKQIAALHGQNRRTFVSAVALELACRLLSSFEIMFILLVLTPDVSYIHCVLILAFTSLLANILFFMPLQLGGREGGFLLSSTGLAMTASSGIFVALIVRLRELIWTAIGLLMMKTKA